MRFEVAEVQDEQLRKSLPAQALPLQKQPQLTRENCDMEHAEILKERPVQENVVPAYPYDDALYSLFHNSLVDSNGNVKQPVKRPSGFSVSKYNTNLFPPGVEQLHGRAAAVACLFENIILSPRSVELPDVGTYTKSDGYSHPDLRLQMPAEAPPQFGKFRDWIDYGPADGGMLYSEWDHLEGISIELRTRRAIKSFFKRHRALFPETAYVDFTINTISAVHLALKYNAVLLGNEVFHEFYCLLRTEAPPEMELFPNIDDQSVKMQQVNWTDIETFSLDFAPATIDTFAAIRMNKEIREYGKEWRSIIRSSPPAELRQNLLNAMAKANQTASIANKASGILSMIGTFLTWVGWLLPGSSIADIAVDIADKAIGNIEKRSNWSMVGPRMHSVAQKANLEKYLSQHKTGD